MNQELNVRDVGAGKKFKCHARTNCIYLFSYSFIYLFIYSFIYLLQMTYINTIGTIRHSLIPRKESIEKSLSMMNGGEKLANQKKHKLSI